MASFSSVRTLLQAAHGGSGLPAAALKAAARSGASFVVVCPAGDRAKAVVAALQAATKGAGLVLSSRVVARASKRSAGVGDGSTGEDAEDVFFVADGEDRTGHEVDDAFFVGSIEDRTGEQFDDVFFVEAGDYSNGEEVTNGDDTKLKDGFLVGAGSDRTSNDSKDADAEMTMEELALMFQKETAMLLKSVKLFPMDPASYEDTIPDLIAACDALGEQLREVHSAEGRTALHQSLIAFHLRIVSSAGGVKDLKVGSYMPDMWVGHRDRLPCEDKRAGTLMEVLLYSMMLASTALAPFVSVPGELTSVAMSRCSTSMLS